MRRTLPILVIILFFAFIYLFRLDRYPTNFSRDEASVAYNAYSVLKTGLDEWGQIPIFNFKGPGDYPPSLILYTTIPSIFIFGLNQFASRLPTAIFALLSFFPTYIFVKKISQNHLLAFLCSSLILITPTFIINGRSASEVIFAYFFTLHTLNSFLDRRHKITIVFAFLTLLSYLSTRLTLPLLLISLTLIYPQYRLRSSYLMIGLVCFLAAGLTFFSQGNTRFQNVSLLNQPIAQTVNVLSEQDGLSFNHLALSRLFHNKLTQLSKNFINNYMAYLNTDFLFLSGGFPTRFKISNVGLLLLIEAPFLLVGLITSHRQNRSIFYLMLLFWIISILPASVTFEYTPNLRRSFFLIFPSTFFIAYGLYQFSLTALKITRFHLGRIGIIAVCLLFCLNFAYVADQFVVHTEFDFAFRRTSDYLQFLEFLNQNQAKYPQIFFTSHADNPYIFLAFYNALDPRLLQQQALFRPDNFIDKEWQLGNITFVADDCPYGLAKGALYVGKGQVCIQDPLMQPKINLVNSFTSPATPIYDVYTDR